MAKKAHEKCSLSLAKSHSDFTLLLLEWLLSGTQTTNVGEDLRKKDPSYTAGGNVS
jgi:hypothetical protein